MKNIVSHIRYLLTQHDCVVVPRWGAIVVQHVPATINADTGAINPPHRWLSFNSLLAHNDGTLAHSIMRTSACGYEQAMTCIEEQVSAWRDALRQGNVVEWERIGHFHIREENQLIFTEAQDVEITAMLSLLQPLTLPTLSQILSVADTDIEPEIVTGGEELDYPRHITIKRVHRLWQAVASVAALVIVLLSISTPVDEYETTGDYASLVAVEIFGTTTPQQVIAEPLQPAESEIPTSETIDSNDLVTTTSPSDVENSDEYTATCTPHNVSSLVAQQEPTTIDEHPRYILVIGSLPSLAQARLQINNFVEQGVTQEIKIYESNGKYRLYIEGYNSMQQAQERLDALMTQPQSPFAGMWICSTRL